MQIRRAQEKDAERVLALLSQVLELHAALAFYRKKGFAPEKTKMEFILPRDDK